MTTKSEATGFGWYMGAFVLGAAAGVTVALLTAPGTGRQTRERLKNVARDIQKRAGRVSGAIQSTTAEAVESSQDAFEKVRKEAS